MIFGQTLPLPLLLMRLLTMFLDVMVFQYELVLMIFSTAGALVVITG